MSEKLGTPLKARITVSATWTGEFPVHMLAKDQAFILHEVYSRRIDDSLAPYVDAGLQKVELVKYSERYQKNSISRFDGTVYMDLAEWDIKAWRDAGVKLEFVRAEQGCRKKYRHLLFVRFDRFPVDMLRYDSCFPASEKDAQAISDSLTIVGRDIYRAVVVKYTDTKRQPRVWWVDRWVSFGGVAVEEIERVPAE